MRSDNQLLDDIFRIRHIRAVIVHGRYDVLCPSRIAWELHRAWPRAQLRIVHDAGHSAFEPGITHELVSATDRFANRPARRRSSRGRSRPN
jgi:proline iminopeptidase